MTFARTCVVGAGLIGGSVARRLMALGVDVVVVDPDPATLEHAAGVGLATAPAVPADRDLVVLAAPLHVLSAVMVDVAAAAPDAVVVDLGSVKQVPATAAANAGLAERYVGAHPMAGTEHSGFAHSADDLLVGVTWAVTHGVAPGAAATVARVVGWVAETFEAEVVVLDAVAHDRSVALVSHGPHAVAHALLSVAECSPDAGVASHLAAGSFRDGTRVAGRNAARTGNMLAENAAALGPVLDEVIAELTGLRADLTDPVALRVRLERIEEAAGTVRHAETPFESCASLVDLVESSRASGRAVVVRLRDGELETATPAGRKSE
ncbi:MAG: prephenate dehydrogenase/arogenate dehydrogenase family protein [Nocardioides sp.]